MTRIDFYILQDVDLSAMRRFACRLVTKAVGSGQRAYLHTVDESAAKQAAMILTHNATAHEQLSTSLR